jgi:hypothetical protein
MKNDLILNDLTRNDQIVLDRLLSEILGRLDGAVDFWTIVILSNAPPNPRDFVLHYSEILRSLVVVTRAILGKTHDADPVLERGLLDRMTSNCQKLQDAFLVLEQFRTIPLDEIRPATVAIAEVYHDLREAIHQLGQTLGLSISYWQSHGQESQDYHQRILGNLFDQFSYERETGDAAAAVYPVPSRQTK